MTVVSDYFHERIIYLALFVNTYYSIAPLKFSLLTKLFIELYGIRFIDLTEMWNHLNKKKQWSKWKLCFTKFHSRERFFVVAPVIFTQPNYFIIYVWNMRLAVNRCFSRFRKDIPRANPRWLLKLNQRSTKPCISF